MSLPECLVKLIHLGVIDEVIRPLQAGKEAQIYLIISDGEQRVAKVYKEATERSFKHRSAYTEGRTVQNSRQQRAMDKGSRYGRKKTEDAWRDAEADCLYRLFGAGVRVPTPYNFVDGVLIMELICDGNGAPAPRLVDLAWSPEDAESMLIYLVGQVVRMLCIGVVHGDLSDFNILVDSDGPVIIDFPQAVDPASNQQAKKLLIRDVRNLTTFLGRFAPHLKERKYGEEMWALYEQNKLTPETQLTGQFTESSHKADTHSLLAEVLAEAQDAANRTGPRPGQSKYAARKAKRLKEQAEAAAEQAREEAEAAQKARSEAPEGRRNRSGRRGKQGQKGPQSEERRRERGNGNQRGQRPQQSGEQQAKGRAGAEQGQESDGPPRRRRRRRRKNRSPQNKSPQNKSPQNKSPK